MARKKEDVAKGFAARPKTPKRSVVPETEARKFERTLSPAAEPPSGSKLRRQERGERLSAYVPPELAESLRVRCAREHRSVSDAVTEALSAWISGTTAPQS